MSRRKNEDLEEAIQSYENWSKKLDSLRNAPLSDKLALLFDWVYSHQISKTEFVYLITKVLFRAL